MRFVSALVLVLSTGLIVSTAGANPRMVRFEYQDAEVVTVIQDYAKASGQRFVIDAGVKGKVTVINPSKVTVEEAFNQLSTALATNGIAISKQGDVMLVQPARNIQRNLIDVTTELPPLRPEKMVTWIINLKHAKADEVNRQLRILASKDGELVPYTATNQILVSDWVSNLHRIGKIISQIDRPGRVRNVAKTAPSEE